MRINALKYRTEDKREIIIVVDLQVGYGYQNNNIWRIVDIIIKIQNIGNIHIYFQELEMNMNIESLNGKNMNNILKKSLLNL